LEVKDTAPYLPGFDEVRSRISAGDIADMFRPATYEGTQPLPATVVVDNAPIAHRKRKFPWPLHGASR
jgi:hypothetical protein